MLNAFICLSASPRLSLRYGWIGLLLCGLGLYGSCFEGVWAVPSLKKSSSASVNLWYTGGVQVKPAQDDQHIQLTGQGRTAIQALRRGVQIQFPLGGVRVQESNTLLYVDQVGQQARLMVLKGKASLVMGHHEYPLPASLQAMIVPQDPAQRSRFLYDGVYRRPVLLDEAVSFESPQPRYQVIIRQFYLEQLVHIDPLMRAIYEDSKAGQKLVNRLNRSAANLRMMNGVDGYVPKQM